MMNKYCRLIFFLVFLLSICTSILQAKEEKATNEQAKETSTSDSDIQTLPVKPSEKIIEQKLSFNSWIDQGFEELSKKIPSLKAKGKGEYESDNIYDFLEELLELYYEYGIKYFKNDTTISELIDQTFENIKSAIEPYAVRKDKHTLIFMEKEEGGLEPIRITQNNET